MIFSKDSNIKLINYLKSILFLIAAVFVVLSLINNKEQLFSINWNLNYYYLSLSLIILLIAIFLYASQLQSTIESEKLKISFSKVLSITAKSNFIRYIPGGIWNHLSMGIELKSFFKDYVSIRKITKLITLNLLITIVAGIFFVIPFLPQKIILLFIVVYFLFLTKIQFIFNIFTNIKFFKKYNLNFKIDSKVLFKTWFKAILYWLAIALSFYFFAKAFNLIDNFIFLEKIKVGSSFVVSWIIGFLFLPIPSGLGVREYVLAYLLNNLSGFLTYGLTLSIAYRILILLRDILILPISKIFVKKFN